jgi:hypothetical protein
MYDYCTSTVNDSACYNLLYIDDHHYIEFDFQWLSHTLYLILERSIILKNGTGTILIKLQNELLNKFNEKTSTCTMLI